MFLEIVKRAAEAAGIDKLAPHDLRRTSARLCYLASGELDQIQNPSVMYPSRQRNITSAENGSFGSL